MLSENSDHQIPSQKAVKTYVDNKTSVLATKEELTTGLSEKQDVISDLDTIRQGAALGATALQAVPDEYVTETELAALNFVKWVDSLPETGESKYIYAVPREETDTDGKQIAALYLWDGSAWRGAGAFSLNIDPDTIAKKTDLKNYLPLTGGRVTGQLIVDNNTIAKAVYVKDPALVGTWYRALRNNGSSGNIIVGQYDGVVGTEIQTPKNTITANIKGTSTNILTALDKSVANGVASLDANAKVPSEQIPVATSSTFGGVKPDGTTITVTEDGTISAVGGSGSGSGFDFEGTKAEFDAAVAAGTITADSVSLITDDVDGANVATKAELQAVDRSKADTSLSNVLANIDYVIESKFPTADDPTWYRVYKSGWLEQGGGYGEAFTEYRNVTITLLKPFRDIKYTLVHSNSSSGNSYEGVTSAKTVSTFSIFNATNKDGLASWEAKGMGAN